MDPVSIVVAAVALGAQEGIRDTVSTAVKDAYTFLKRLIADRYKGVDPSAVESKPTSKAKRESLEEDLIDAGAGEDAELLSAAQKLIEAVRTTAPAAGAAIGVDLEDLEAEALRIQRVRSEGGAVRVRGAKVAGPVEISDINSGPQGSTSNPQ
ncbi:hypothetical protein [Mycobacterium sp. shizuoka-1]|uniref:hypothetical protein n=1 Tax=Mycobacterium sp. shizuoka-1 TaxID=2039281 RepID=UPI000C06020E|nr:hypothetical protein [Mycobacterium sp. shizuoka-1]GAY13608.1 hypothetical protein MSZK_03340 [Mycobacterium sp. shizuoka-1]